MALNRLSDAMQQAAIYLYSRANRMGLFELPFNQRLFRKAYFQYKSHFEDPYCSLIHQKPELFKNGHILDLGANIGYTSLLFSSLLTPGFKVYSFEPENRNFNSLKNLITEHHLADRMIPIHAAVGDQKGTTDLWINPKNQSDHRLVTLTFHGEDASNFTTQSVPVLRVDDYVKQIEGSQTIAFIKIDVQGFEGPVLNGMEQTLAKNPQAAVGVEYCPEMITALGFSPQDLLDFFEQRNYDAFVLSRPYRSEKIEFSRIHESVGTRGYIDVLCIKRPSA